MRTKIKEYNDQYVFIQFFPDNDHEKDAITAVRSSRANDSQELAVVNWVEQALLKTSGQRHSVTAFVDVQNNIYYIFSIQKVGSLGGY